jgi:hypothetical protein
VSSDVITDGDGDGDGDALGVGAPSLPLPSTAVDDECFFFLLFLSSTELLEGTAASGSPIGELIMYQATTVARVPVSSNTRHAAQQQQERK